MMPSEGGVGECKNTPGQFILRKPEIHASLMFHWARKQTVCLLDDEDVDVFILPGEPC